MRKLHPGWSLGSDDELLLEESDVFGAGDPPSSERLFGEPATAGRSSTTLSGDAFSAAADVALPPAPRITIHAACDRLEITGLIASVSADRRLANAEITVAHGGVEAAITRFADRPSPNLLIIDTLQRGAAMLHSLDRLAQVIEQSTKVVVIGAVDDFALFRELMARGVSEYIVPPIQALDLIGTICKLYVDPAKPLAGRVIAVLGARGGVGASTIAHNIAWSIAERQGSRTTLLDLDLSFGTAALDFNEDPQQSIADALTAPDRVDDVFLQCITTKATQRLHMLTAPATLERDFQLEGSSYEMVIERVRRASPFVVLDLPHLWTGWVKQTLCAADDVIIVAGPDLASLRNTRNIVDLLKARRPYDSPPAVVLSMTGMPKRPEIPFKDFAEGLGVEPKASIPFDPQLFGMAASNGRMIGEAAPASKAAVTLDALAASLTGRKPAETKKASLANKITFLKR